MAVYSFECDGCGEVVERVFGMLEVGKRRRLKCGCGGSSEERGFVLLVEINPEGTICLLA